METQDRKKRVKLKRIIRFLKGNGCEPQKREDYVVFTYQGYMMHIEIEKDGVYTRMGAIWKQMSEVDRRLLLESMNTVNDSIKYAKATLSGEDGLIIQIQFDLRSVRSFKQSFHFYCNCILYANEEITDEYKKRIESIMNPVTQATVN